MKNGLQAGAVLALALILTACAPTTGTKGAKLAPGETLQITQRVWDDYQEYVARGRGLSAKKRSGAFGVALVAGRGVAGLYSYRHCPRDYDNCIVSGPSEIDDVLDACRREGLECLIFARDENIVVPYEIVD
jgi:hypothetical protein